MSKHIDYYLSLQSPWTYLGHQQLLDIAAQRGATVTPWPLNFALVFPATGGLPLPKRAPARQHYRLAELRRWRDRLGVPLNLEPAHFPADERLAAAAVVTLRERDPAAALRLAGLILAAVWAEQKNIAETDIVRAAVDAAGADGAALLAEVDIARDACREKIDADSHTAIERGVFGAPSYIVNDELFWGQDRLEFVDGALASPV